VKNAILLAKAVSDTNSVGFITVPPVDQEEGEGWRKNLYKVLEENNIQFEIPGRNNRLVYFRI
jgi:hypothetical protein